MTARDLILRLQQAQKLANSFPLLLCRLPVTSAAEAELPVSVGCSRPCPSCHLWTRRPSPSRSSTSSGTGGLLVWSSQRLSSHTSVQSTPTTSTATTSATTLTTGKQPGVLDGVCRSHTSLCFIWSPTWHALTAVSILLQVLDYVQAAHVRLQRRWPSSPGDQQRCKVLP